MIPHRVVVSTKRILHSSLRIIQCGHTGFYTYNSRTPVSTLLSSSSTSFHISLDNCHSVWNRDNLRSLSDAHSRQDAGQEFQEDLDQSITQLENGEKEQLIKSASLENLMQIATKIETPFQASLVLQRLNILHKENRDTHNLSPEIILEDPCMTTVVKILDKNILKISPKVLISCLTALYEMTSKDTFLVKTLITQVLWITRKLPIPVVMQVLQLHVSHQETPMRKAVLQQGMVVVEKRWVELSKCKDIIYLMYLCGGQLNSQSLMDRLEERALDLVEQASVKELHRIIYLLSRHRHRNTSLIRAALYHLNKGNLSDLSAVQLSNLLYACATLNVFDTPLMEKASSVLPTKQGELTPKLVESVLTSMSHLKWGHMQTVQHLIEHLNCKKWSSALFDLGSSVDSSLAGNNDTLSLVSLNGAERVSIVLSLANLNQSNAMCCELVEKMVASPEVRELQQTSPVLWLDVVWSAAVLKLITAELAASVLTEDFWCSLPVSDSFQSIVSFTKLNNINAAARHDIAGYLGPHLPDTFFHNDAKVLLRGERKASEKVISALLHMAPQDSYTILDVTVPGGYMIDAEFFVDKSGEPQPLMKAARHSSLFHKIALKVLDFPDLVLPNSEVTGLHAMAARHLRCQGYTVVHVLHTEVTSRTKVLEVVQLVQRKVKEALENAASPQPAS